MNFKWVTEHGGKLLGRHPFEAVGRKSRRLTSRRKVEHVQLPFRQWDGCIGPWNEHFGKGHGQIYPLLGSKPKRSCNEVEVAKILRQICDHAFWFSAYNTANMPKIWRPWVRSMDELPPWLKEFDSIIRVKITSQHGGMPDVVAWNDDHPLRSALFVECKGPKEKFKESQEDWISAAFVKGLEVSHVAISVRSF
jgi:hypothetical protein